jgi:nicastrin
MKFDIVTNLDAVYYMHQEKSQNPSNNITNALQNAIDGYLLNVDLQMADSTTTPGIPPSSLMSFLKAKPDITGVVLADHNTVYNNEYVTFISIDTYPYKILSQRV